MLLFVLLSQGSLHILYDAKLRFPTEEQSHLGQHCT